MSDCRHDRGWSINNCCMSCGTPERTIKAECMREKYLAYMSFAECADLILNRPGEIPGVVTDTDRINALKGALDQMKVHTR